MAEPATQKLPDGHLYATLLVEPSGQKNPGLQAPLHCAESIPDAAEYRPAGQGEHKLAPSKLYLPDPQRKLPFAEPVGHTAPGGHLMGVADVEPFGQKNPA